MEKKKSIKLKLIQKSFGNSIYRPACDNALRFCQIADVSLLDERLIYLIKKLGFEINVVTE